VVQTQWADSGNASCLSDLWRQDSAYLSALGAVPLHPNEEAEMSRARRLLKGAALGMAFTVAGLGFAPNAFSSELADEWKLQCDGNICCTVNGEGKIGDCKKV
jgi:hypothetical protein